MSTATTTPALEVDQAEPPAPAAGAYPVRVAAEPVLGPLTRGGVLRLTLASTLVVAVGDVLTGTEASFTLLYLGPIAVATWFVSTRAGYGLALVSSVLSISADLSDRPEALGRAVVVWNVAVQAGVFLAVVWLLGQFRDRLEREQQLARTDALTQVANRRAFIEAAALELERARRHGRPLTMAYVDCDGFKDVNDTLGHAQGDALLVTAARTLRGATRAVDAVARLGGDEFGLLLPETDGPTAQSLLARLQATLAEAMARHGWRVSYSIGAATFAAPPASVDELMARADVLMYEAKRAAKGSVRLQVVGAGEPEQRTLSFPASR